MGEFLGVGPVTWRVILGIGLLAAIGFAIGAVTEAAERDWTGTAYLTVIAVLILQLVWRGWQYARRNAGLR